MAHEYKVKIGRQRKLNLKFDDDILDDVDESEIVAQVAVATEMSRAVEKVIRRVNTYLTKTAEGVANRGQGEQVLNVKLPTIVLPKFSGNTLEWQQCYDIYGTAVHSRTYIADAVKFHYQHSQLTGEAAQLIVGFNHTDD